MSKSKKPSGPSPALQAKIKADKASARGPSEDRLEKVRAGLRQARDKEREASDLEARARELRGEVVTLTQQTLPDLFDEAGIDNLGLSAEGNLPAYDCKLGPFYHANIAAEWPEEKRTAAFNYLAEQGAEDLIKSLIIVALPRGERKLAQRVEEGLRKAGVPFTTKLDVAWNTLTAWVREQVEKQQTTPKLDLIGGNVGRVVKLKERT